MWKNGHPSPRPPLRAALLCSRRAPGLSYLFREDPNRGRLYDWVCAVTSEPDCEDLGRLREAGVPVRIHDIHAFYAERRTRLADRAVRREYDRATADLLRDYCPDVLALSGYLYLVTEPLLEAYPGRIVNVHDSDLTITDSDGRPRYRGLRSTHDAIFAGASETRCTAHLVTAELDQGAPLVCSWPFPVHPLAQQARECGVSDAVKAYAYAQREWMMAACWGPVLAEALALLARDAVQAVDGLSIIEGSFGPLTLTEPAVARPLSAGPVPARRAGG